MKYRAFSVASILALLLLNSGLTGAIETKTEPSSGLASKGDAGSKNAKSEVDVKHMQPAKIKLVDINSASKAELMKLPGLSAAQADKIIAGRPFGSKAWLVTNNILPELTYEALKRKIVCGGTKADYDKIMARAAKSKK